MRGYFDKHPQLQESYQGAVSNGQTDVVDMYKAQAQVWAREQEYWQQVAPAPTAAEVAAAATAAAATAGTAAAGAKAVAFAPASAVTTPEMSPALQALPVQPVLASAPAPAAPPDSTESTTFSPSSEDTNSITDFFVSCYTKIDVARRASRDVSSKT
jgi:Tfp pilus assembly protein FimV